MSYLSNALDNLRPNSVWHISVIDGVEKIIWKNNTEAPSEEEIQAKIAELEAAEPLRQLRIKRNQLLQQTDWRATVDYPNPDKQAWLDYRQALRDLPETAEPQLDENGQLTNIVWPEEPQ